MTLFKRILSLKDEWPSYYRQRMIKRVFRNIRHYGRIMIRNRAAYKEMIKG